MATTLNACYNVSGFIIVLPLILITLFSIYTFQGLEIIKLYYYHYTGSWYEWSIQRLFASSAVLFAVFSARKCHENHNIQNIITYNIHNSKF